MDTIMSRYYKTTRTYNYKDRVYETSEIPSQTVDAEILSMRETLARYQEGLSPQPKQVQYLDVDDIEEINDFYSPGSLDLTDLDALNSKVSRLQEMIEDAHGRKVKDDLIKEEEKQRKREELRAEVDNAESE